MAGSFLGRKHTPETIEKMRQRRGPEKRGVWKGDAVGDCAAHDRCRSIYPGPLGQCEHEGCDRPAIDRHHADGNPRNNLRGNVRFLCRRCHQLEDGRLSDRIAEMVAASRGRKRSEEFKRKVSETKKRMWREGQMPWLLNRARGQDGRWQKA